jgi:hypothetical protein
MLRVLVLLLVTTAADAAPCNRPASLPTEIPLLSCPSRVRELPRGCLKSGDNCPTPNQRNFELAYDGEPSKIADAWKTTLDAAGWKVEVIHVPSSEPPRAYDVIRMLRATRGNLKLFTSVLIGPGTNRAHLLVSL